jgi:multidrug efflux system outer membrane protein
MRVLRARGVIVCLLVSSCTVGPNYKAPPAPNVPVWKDTSANGAAVAEQSDPDPKWWNSFNDPVLSELIEKAIAENPDVLQAVLRVVESRQSVVAARAAGLPTLNASGRYQHEQVGAQGLLESQGAYKNLNTLADHLQPLDSVAPGLSQGISGDGNRLLNKIADPVNLYQYGLDSSWELDLFGRVRRSVEQARARTQAQSEAANDAFIVLESEVTQAYIRLRGAQALKASQDENLQAASQVLELTQQRQQAGLTTELDVQQARTQMDDTKRQLPAYEKQVQQAMNALSMLTGQNPGALDQELSGVRPLPKIPSLIGVGVPSTLARRRPDIRQAEATLHAATAGIGIAVASFYPDISLTGNSGIRAIDASYLTNWASKFYSFGPSVSVPIFEGGRLTSNLRLARAQTEEAALHYRGTVLNALREVEDALVAYRTDTAAQDQLADTVHSAELTLSLALNQYANGLAGFIDVLDSQRTLLSRRQEQVQADMQLVNDIVALYRALGGGWEQSANDMNAPTVESEPPIVPAALDSVVDIGTSKERVDARA